MYIIVSPNIQTILWTSSIRWKWMRRRVERKISLNACNISQNILSSPLRDFKNNRHIPAPNDVKTSTDFEQQTCELPTIFCHSDVVISGQIILILKINFLLLLNVVDVCIPIPIFFFLLILFYSIDWKWSNTEMVPIVCSLFIYSHWGVSSDLNMKWVRKIRKCAS